MTARTTNRKTQQPKIALIDGDHLIYYLSHMLDGSADEMDFVDAVDVTIDNWTEAAKCEKAIVCLSMFKEKNFRHALYKDYKASRKGRSLPPFVKIGYQHLTIARFAKHKAIRQRGIEADDIMGILATTQSAEENNKVIVTVDKDLMTIPGRHYNPIKKVFTTTTKEESLVLQYTQWLTGDPTDCIPGLPGVGPKKAATIIEDARGFAGDTPLERCLAMAVKRAYKDAGQSEKYWITMGRLVKILTASNWDAKKKVIKEWYPPVKW
jgi:DNA polymerase I